MGCSVLLQWCHFGALVLWVESSSAVLFYWHCGIFTVLLEWRVVLAINCHLGDTWWFPLRPLLVIGVIRKPANVRKDHILWVIMSKSSNRMCSMLYGSWCGLYIFVLWIVFLWPPYGIGQAIIFLPCDFYLPSSSIFSSPNLSGRKLDVYHTFTHGVALLI